MSLALYGEWLHLLNTLNRRLNRNPGWHLNILPRPEGLTSETLHYLTPFCIFLLLLFTSYCFSLLSLSQFLPSLSFSRKTMIISLLSTSEAGPLPPRTNIDAYDTDSDSFFIFDIYQRLSEAIAGMSPFHPFLVFYLDHPFRLFFSPTMDPKRCQPSLFYCTNTA